MKILAIAGILLLAGLFNVVMLQTNTQPNITIQYRTFSAEGNLAMTIARQQRSDGSWYEHQYYIHENKVVAWKRVLAHATNGVFDIKKDKLFFEGETGFFKPDITNLQSTEQILGYDVYAMSTPFTTNYYSPVLNADLKSISKDNGSIRIATSVTYKIDENDFKLPSLPINYDSFITELDKMENKKLAAELKAKYVPENYVIQGDTLCNK